MTHELIPLATERGLEQPLSREEIEKTATFMAQEYQEATNEIAHHMGAIQAQCNRLKTAFTTEQDNFNFDIRFHYNGERFDAYDSRIFADMTRDAWRKIIDQLGIKNIMSVAQREEFEKQLEKGELPPITPESILGIVCNLAGQVQDFAQQAAKEVFNLLRPQRGEYKTNDKFRIGRRVILRYYVERKWDGKGFRISYYHDKHARAIDAVFHLLDGSGVVREHQTPLMKAIDECGADGRGETKHFKFRCCKNRNLHLEFKDLELVKQLNLKAVGEYVLGRDEEEAA